jgi:hypothetical protein
MQAAYPRQVTLLEWNIQNLRDPDWVKKRLDLRVGLAGTRC